jgi:hypothetical protein
MPLWLGQCVGCQEFAPVKWQVDVWQFMGCPTTVISFGLKTGDEILSRTWICPTLAASSCQHSFLCSYWCQLWQTPNMWLPGVKSCRFTCSSLLNSFWTFLASCLTTATTPFNCLSTASVSVSWIHSGQPRCHLFCFLVLFGRPLVCLGCSSNAHLLLLGLPQGGHCSIFLLS